MKSRILIDTDIAMGITERDVDDGLAIVMAMRSQNIHVDGITLTYGNDSLDGVTRSLIKLWENSDFAPIEITQGASSKNDLGKETPATELIAKKLEQEPASIVAIGPATNLASALKLNPQIKSKITEIVMVAARQPGQRFLTGNHPRSHPDLNFERDPQSMQILLDSGVPITFAPFEVSSKVWFNREVLNKLSKNQTKLASYIHEHCLDWLQFWERTFSTPLYPVSGFNPFDTLAVAYFTDHELLNWAYCDIAIELDRYDTTDEIVQGTGSPEKPYLHARLLDRKETGKYKYIYDVDREEFLERLVSKLR